MDKILLLDGHSILNRAFYGVPDFTNTAGEHTGAVMGFLNIMFKVISDEEPGFAAVAFDEHAPTFRHEIYAEYKGTRHAMPDELREQVPMIKEVLRSMGLTVVSKAGLEADDIIGTIASRAEGEGMEVTILSGDRDLLQLVTDKTKLLLPRTVKGETKVDPFYAEDVLRVYQVPPKGIIELKALEGDKSDNIPGVPRIGTKTATELVVKYGNIANLKEHIAEITKKSIRESLEQNFELAELSHTLATINTASDIEVDIADCALNNIYTSEAYEVLAKLELSSILKKFPEVPQGAESQGDSETDFKEVEDLGEVEELFSRLKSANKVGFCILTDESGSLSGIYIAEESGAYFIRVNGFVSPMYLKAHIIDFIEKGSGEYFTAYTKKLFKLTGCEAADTLYDVELLMYLADPLRSEYHIADSASETALTCFKRGEEFLNRVKEAGMLELFKTIERPLAKVLADMEQEGIRVKPEELKSFSELLKTRIDELEQKIIQAAGVEFNINSPKQLSEVLFEKMQLPGGKKTKTGYSTNASVLEKLAPEYPIVSDILNFRTLSKLKATYADGLAPFIGEENRIHSTFNQTITATGRISSADPNLQNIPVRTELGRELRRSFVPREGYIFTDADYSQIELRIMASLSGDEKLIAAYKEDKDIHAITASEVFHVPFEEVTPELRRNAKAVNFGIIYGISSYGLSQDLSIGQKEAKEYIEKYFETYPQVKRFIDSLVESAKEKGYAETYFGRRRPMPELKNSKFAVRSFGERVAMNAPIQGTAADIIKIAMINVYKALKERKLRSRLILQVHDELLVETHPEEVGEVHDILLNEMMGAAKLPVPLEVEIKTGKDWLESH
ncbi:MAG: DNA polymerase I [Lachnospiraceae bacterium]|nr:DNA polymerase I [Lachnospiraceae bacterium]